MRADPEGFIWKAAGIIFILAGAGLAASAALAAPRGGMPAAVLLVFLAAGAAAVLLGLLLLRRCSRRKKEIRRIMETGRCITADITGAVRNWQVKINHQPAWQLQCVWTDPQTGQEQYFVSRNLGFNPERRLTDRQVRVYLDRNSDRYCVDVDSVLGEKKSL